MSVGDSGRFVLGDRIKTLLIADAASDLEAEFLDHHAERKAELLQKAQDDQEQGLESLADELRDQAGRLTAEKPLISPAIGNLSVWIRRECREGWPGPLCRFMTTAPKMLAGTVQQHGPELAAVVTELMRSVDSESRFRQDVRQLCGDCRAALIFDKITTSWRFHPAGCI